MDKLNIDILYEIIKWHFNYGNWYELLEKKLINKKWKRAVEEYENCNIKIKVDVKMIQDGFPDKFKIIVGVFKKEYNKKYERIIFHNEDEHNYGIIIKGETYDMTYLPKGYKYHCNDCENKALMCNNCFIRRNNRHMFIYGKEIEHDWGTNEYLVNKELDKKDKLIIKCIRYYYEEDLVEEFESFDYGEFSIDKYTYIFRRLRINNEKYKKDIWLTEKDIRIYCKDSL